MVAGRTQNERWAAGLLADKRKRTNKTASRDSRADRDCDETLRVPPTKLSWVP